MATPAAAAAPKTPAPTIWAAAPEAGDVVEALEVLEPLVWLAAETAETAVKARQTVLNCMITSDVWITRRGKEKSIPLNVAARAALYIWRLDPFFLICAPKKAALFSPHVASRHELRKKGGGNAWDRRHTLAEHTRFCSSLCFSFESGLQKIYALYRISLLG